MKPVNQSAGATDGLPGLSPGSATPACSFDDALFFILGANHFTHPSSHNINTSVNPAAQSFLEDSPTDQLSQFPSWFTKM